MSMDMQAVFEDALDRVQRGEVSLDQVLREHPAIASELRDLLVVALDLQALTPPPMTPAEIARGMALVDLELQRRAARPPQEQPSLWQRLLPQIPRFMPVRMAGVVAAIGFALIAYGGVTLAAVNSGPGSALYGYRLSLEEVRIAFAAEDERAGLYLENAEARLRDIEQTAAGGDVGTVQHATDAYQDALRKGVSALSVASAAAGPDSQEEAAASVADFRTHLRDHQVRFEELTRATEDEALAPIAVASQSADEGLLDAERGANLAVLPTVAADSMIAVVASPIATAAPTAVVQAPTSPPPLLSPTPAPSPSPTPTPAPTPTPTKSAVSTPESADETPTATASPTPDAVNVADTETVLVGLLESTDDGQLVISGIAVRLPTEGEPPAEVNEVAVVGDWVQAAAVIDIDGRLRLRTLALASPAPSAEPTAAPKATPTPEPTPSPTPEADATPEPTLEGDAGDEATPVATPTPEIGETAADETPTPEPTLEGDAGDEATPVATPTPEPTPSPTPADDVTPESSPQPTTEPSPTPEGDAGGETTPGATATPEASPTPDAGTEAGTDAEATATPEPTASPTPTSEATPEPSPTPADDSAADEPTPTPEPTVSPEPTAAPSPTNEATPTPSPTPDGEAEDEPSPDVTLEPTDSPTPTESPEPTEAASPTPHATPEREETEAAGERLPTFAGILQGVDETTLHVSGIQFALQGDPGLALPDDLVAGSVVVVTYQSVPMDEGASLLVAISIEVISEPPQETAAAALSESEPTEPPAG